VPPTSVCSASLRRGLSNRPPSRAESGGASSCTRRHQPCDIHTDEHCHVGPGPAGFQPRHAVFQRAGTRGQSNSPPPAGAGPCNRVLGHVGGGAGGARPGMTRGGGRRLRWSPGLQPHLVARRVAPPHWRLGRQLRQRCVRQPADGVRPHAQGSCSAVGGAPAGGCLQLLGGCLQGSQVRQRLLSHHIAASRQGAEGLQYGGCVRPAWQHRAGWVQG